MFQAQVQEKIKTHILCSVTFSKSPIIYEKMWTNTVGPDRSQMIIYV